MRCDLAGRDFKVLVRMSVTVLTDLNSTRVSVHCFWMPTTVGSVDHFNVI